MLFFNRPSFRDALSSTSLETYFVMVGNNLNSENVKLSSFSQRRDGRRSNLWVRFTEPTVIEEDHVRLWCSGRDPS